MDQTELTTIDATCGQSCPCGQASGDRGTDGGALKRRDFVAYSAATLALAALAACGLGGDSITSPGTLSATSIKLSDFPALSSVGGVATTSIDGTPIAIVRTGSSSFSAFSRICPHQGGTIIPTGTGFQCPNHGAMFNVSGVWIGGQRTGNLTSYPVQFDSATSTLTVGT